MLRKDDPVTARVPREMTRLPRCAGNPEGGKALENAAVIAAGAVICLVLLLAIDVLWGAV